MSPLAVTSMMASATSATGLTVGWSSSRLPSSVLREKRIYARVLPDIGSVAPILTKLEVVGCH